MWFFGKEKVQIQKRSDVAIRLEAIGGQGAHSAGKILAECAVLGCGFTGNHFSSFGSEKRGTPVRSHVRFSVDRKAVRDTSAIRNPNLLIIFHEALILSHPDILSGVGPETDILVNSPHDPQAVLLPNGVQPRWIATIDANKIVQKSGGGMNAALLGAASLFLPEIPERIFADVLGSFYKNATEEKTKANLQAFNQGTAGVKVRLPIDSQHQSIEVHSVMPRLGYENAPIGGLITQPGNSILKNHEASRKGFAPRLDLDVCFNCGYCDMVCPDYCFVWELSDGVPTLRGIDYQYCKGCQKCIEVCPVNALKHTPENEIPDAERLKKFSVGSS